MKQHITIYVKTEYHLLHAINHFLMFYTDSTKYLVKMYLHNSTRLDQIDFSSVPFEIEKIDLNIDLKRKLVSIEKRTITNLIRKQTDVFIFFQEQDPLMILLASEFRKKGAIICLFQDGMKPYGMIKYQSLALIVNDIKQNLWLSKNGFSVPSWSSSLYCKNYAFLKSISKIFLTHPLSYKNWNNKEVNEIKIADPKVLSPLLKSIFRWDENLLKDKYKIILFLNQPIQEGQSYEMNILDQISEQFPQSKIFIKLHPLTTKKQLEAYNKVNYISIINSSIPAELFLMHIVDSIILTISSTSVLYNNPLNKYYSMRNIFIDHIKRLRRRKMNQPAKHVNYINSIDEIEF